MALLRDPVASSSHFLMAVLALVAGILLVRLARADQSRRLCVLVFVVCMVLLYTASGLYHAVRLSGDDLVFFQLVDMSAIYLMIAGSSTPLVYTFVRGRLRAALLAAQWGVAGLGIASLWVLPKPEHEIMIACYMGLGWLCCAGIGHYWRALGWDGLRWFVLSAVIYLLGAIIELMNWPVLWPGVIRAHELLHFCDVGGTVVYLVFLVKCVIPYVDPELALEGQDEQAPQFATSAQV